VPPFATLRGLPTLTLYAILAAISLLCLAGRTPWSTAPGKRPILASAFAALALAALFSVAGCGGGMSTAQSALVPDPQTTSIITVAASATNPNGTPLANLPPIQLTLIVN